MLREEWSSFRALRFLYVRAVPGLVSVAVRGTAPTSRMSHGGAGEWFTWRFGGSWQCRVRCVVGFAAHKLSSHVTLPIGGGRIAYVVAPSTAQWFRGVLWHNESIITRTHFRWVELKFDTAFSSNSIISQ